MTETTFTFRVDEALKAAFTEAARARDRPGSVEQGRRELADPTIQPIPHEQIVAEWEAERADLLARMAPARRRH